MTTTMPRLTCLALLVPVVAAADPAVRGDAVIQAHGIHLTTTARLAGAIHSLRWDDQEFIDSADHGRQLQTALSAGTAGPGFWPESFNPTEAGSRRDGAGPTSSSRLEALMAADGHLRTTSRLAFWLRPDEVSFGHPARNTAILSDVRLTKDVTIGIPGHPQVIAYDVAIDVPAGITGNLLQVEALTGYSPERFHHFYALPSESGTLVPLDDGPGEQAHPVVIADAEGRHAMACVSRCVSPLPNLRPGYGRFAFAREHVVKWNCVYRFRSATDIPAGTYRFHQHVLVGTLSQVEADLRAVLAPR